MDEDSYMYYIVYKITNLVNGKIYIGVHKTDDLNDGYMGSGKLIKAAIEKYGVENFSREYLHVYDNAEDMFKMESELVNEEFVTRDDTYNLKVGGFGGFDYINSVVDSNQKRTAGAKDGLAYINRYRTDEKFRAEENEKRRVARELWLSSEEYENYRKLYELKHPNGTFFGKAHSDETKLKIGAANAIRQRGDKNSQFGTMWITNSESGESKKIKKDDLIPDGWVKGRKLRKFED